MASKIYNFDGIINWAKVHKPDEKYDTYTLDLVLDDASLQKFKDSGLQLKLRDSEEGQYIKLRRPTTKQIKGETIDLGPPTVLLKEEDGEYRETKKLIGNGSIGTARVRVYDTMQGKGHELLLVAVSDLVPFGDEVADDADDYPF